MHQLFVVMIIRTELLNTRGLISSLVVKWDGVQRGGKKKP